MNAISPRPLTDLVDILLMDVALKIQISRTDHELAVDRYRVINEWVERAGSPLQGKVRTFYPQGSMATRSCISSKLDNDEFDLDILAELQGIPIDASPRWVLDTLFDVINGPKGSRYHGKVRRQTRCVTVDYDAMHLDVTPAWRLPGRDERVSHIFHSKVEEAPHRDKRITANPWGFAEWFLAATPFHRLAMDAMEKSGAEIIPVPSLHPLQEKSLAVLALQLLKRWRNKKYDQRTGRRPPSVMLACMVGEEAQAARLRGGPRTSLYAELFAQASGMLLEFSIADSQGYLVKRVNPRCPGDDVLTDRWPGTPSAQAQFTRDLSDLVANLKQLAEPVALEKKRAILADLFGERAAQLALDAFNERMATAAGSGGLSHVSGTGAISIGLYANPRATPIPRHTNFGGSKPRLPWGD